MISRNRVAVLGWMLGSSVAVWAYACGGNPDPSGTGDGGSSEEASRDDAAQPETGTPREDATMDDATKEDATMEDANGTLGAEASADGTAAAQSDAGDASGGDAGEAGVIDAAVADAPVDASSSTGSDATSVADAGDDGAASGGLDAAVDCGPCTGTMFNGRCIETLATGQTSTYAIATDGVDVYWTNSGNYTPDAGSVMRVSVCGGAVIPILQGETAAHHIAVDSQRVFWTDQSQVKAWSKADGTISTLASNQVAPFGVTVYDGTLYWALGSADGGIQRMPLDGGPVTALAAHIPNPFELVVSPTHVYWIQGSGSDIFSTTLSGGITKIFFYDSNYSVAGIGIDSNNLYYTEQSGLGPVGVVPLDGGTAPPALAHDNGTLAVISDGTYVYYTSPDGDGQNFDGAVLRVPVAGGTPVTLATGGYPKQIAIDATSVYWTSERNDTITKVSPR